MRAKRSGALIAISSVEAYRGLPDSAVYSTAKAALNQYIKVMAKKYAEKEIRFNSVSPGNVIFDGSQWEEKLKSDEKNTNDYIKKNVPMGKFIEPQDVAEMVYYLSSNNSRFITGQNFVIDGGQSL